MTVFRDALIEDNYRDPQVLNKRVIYYSHTISKFSGFTNQLNMLFFSFLICTITETLLTKITLL
jgi:hypothetical protein